MRSTLDIEHEGNLGDEDITRFTFDEASIAHLMQMLTELYSDPALAVLREYSTNGQDAHVASGQTRPIEVTLPNPMSPTAIFEDFGTGMSLDTIRDVLTKYGKSTKRETDEQTGMMGLGFKAGLAYTSQFTVVSRKDGIESVVLVTRLEDGGAALQIINSGETDKENGTIVSVPVKDVSRFNRTAKTFFRFWEPGAILVNGEQPDCVFNSESVIVIDPDVFLTDNDDIGCDYIVMGNVAYPVDDKNAIMGTTNRHGYVHREEKLRVIARVPIGSVNFTPSREGLKYTKRTLETITTLRDYVTEARHRVAQQTIDACDSRPDALDAYFKVRAMTKLPLTWRGEAFVDHVKVLPDEEDMEEGEHRIWHEAFVAMGQRSIVRGGNQRRSGSEWVDLWTASRTSLIVTGYVAQGVHSTFLEKLGIWTLDHPEVARTFKMYADDYTGHNPEHAAPMMLIRHDPKSPWLEHAVRVTADEIRAVQLPKVEGSARSKRAPWRIISEQGHLRDQSPTDPQDLHPVLYITPDYPQELRERLFRFTHWMMQAQGVPGNKWSILNITKADQARLRNNFPELPGAAQFFETAVGWLAANMTPENRASCQAKTAVDSAHEDFMEEVRTLVRFRDEKVQDLELLAFVAAVSTKQDRSFIEAWNLGTYVAQDINRTRGGNQPKLEMPVLPSTKNLRAWAKRLMARYPLLVEMHGRYAAPKGVWVEYINNTYLIQEQVNLLPITY